MSWIFAQDSKQIKCCRIHEPTKHYHLGDACYGFGVWTSSSIFLVFILNIWEYWTKELTRGEWMTSHMSNKSTTYSSWSSVVTDFLHGWNNRRNMDDIVPTWMKIVMSSNCTRKNPSIQNLNCMFDNKSRVLSYSICWPHLNPKVLMPQNARRSRPTTGQLTVRYFW